MSPRCELLVIGLVGIVVIAEIVEVLLLSRLINRKRGK
jgi:hypothetical protein